jgi:diguanylate cyclase (GGDEF)-like protein
MSKDIRPAAMMLEPVREDLPFKLVSNSGPTMRVRPSPDVVSMQYEIMYHKMTIQSLGIAFATVDEADDHIRSTDEWRRMMSMDGEFERDQTTYVGSRVGYWLERCWFDRIHPLDVDRVRSFWDKRGENLLLVEAGSFAREVPTDIEHRVLRDGEERWVRVSLKHIGRIPVGCMPGSLSVALIATDVTRERRYTHDLKEWATFDDLTKLYNRRSMFEHIAGQIQRKPDQREDAESHSGLTVFYIDLNRFKSINDGYGHASGDAVLQLVAGRLKSSLRNAIVCRLGGDEFAVVVDFVPNLKAAERIAQRIVETLCTPVDLNDVVWDAGGVVGVAFANQGEFDGEELVKAADNAMLVAKERYRDGQPPSYEIYQPGYGRSSRTHLNRAFDLRRAVRENEIEPWFQPIVYLNEPGRVAGGARTFKFESLARWRHSDRSRGIVLPGEFIDLTGELGLLPTLSMDMLRLSLQAWRHSCSSYGAYAPKVAINLPVQWFETDGFFNDVAMVLSDEGVPPSAVMFELTEQKILRMPESALVDRVKQLAALGFGFSIDDFGVESSNLDRLAQLPFTEIKLDRSFIVRLRRQENGRVRKVLECIIEIASKLNADVIGEGLETIEDVENLRGLRCTYGQGYYFSRAFPASDVTKWLLANPPTPAISTEHMITLGLGMKPTLASPSVLRQDSPISFLSPSNSYRSGFQNTVEPWVS